MARNRLDGATNAMDRGGKNESDNPLLDVMKQNFWGDLPTPEEAVAAGDDIYERVVLLEINDITPDLHQARRILPSALRRRWTGMPADAPEMLAAWWDMAQQESGPINIEQVLLDPDDRPTLSTPGPIASKFMDLLDLAASIRSEGLTNEVTVISLDNGSYQEPMPKYRIETGERRWWAFHLLANVIVNEREKWSQIPARIVEQFNPFRQSNENNVRVDLGLVGKARQYAILMIYLHEQHGHQFQPDQAFDHEREYYAQVASDDIKAPYGTTKRILAAMGLKARSQLSTYRKVLTAPNHIWDQADDLDWTEAELFSMLNSLATKKQSGVKAKERRDDVQQYEIADAVKRMVKAADKKIKSVRDMQFYDDGERQKTREYAAELRKLADELEDLTNDN